MVCNHSYLHPYFRKLWMTHKISVLRLTTEKASQSSVVYMAEPGLKPITFC